MKPARLGIVSVLVAGLACSLINPVTAADPEPVSIVAKRISGHVHPSICQTEKGTLVVVFQGSNVLMCSRSTDFGKTWSKPFRIETTSKRPDIIRPVKRFEVYPGTTDTLPDGRILVTWNYIADDKAKDGYYERALLYCTSSDDGKTWSEQQLIGPVAKKHLGAVRHNVLPWDKHHWLLPLRVGPPRLFNPTSGEQEVFPLIGPDKNQHEYQQIIRTTKGSLLAMGPVLLHSTDSGRTWTEIKNFPAIPDKRDNAEGRYLTALSDGRVLVTWGVGHDNKGIRYNISSDDGQTWHANKTVVLLSETPIAARYYSARTIQIDDKHIGSVFMNSNGVHFIASTLRRLAQP